MAFRIRSRDGGSGTLHVRLGAIEIFSRVHPASNRFVPIDIFGRQVCQVHCHTPRIIGTATAQIHILKIVGRPVMVGIESEQSFVSLDGLLVILFDDVIVAAQDEKPLTIRSGNGQIKGPFYIQTGAIKIAATSSTGKEAVAAILHPGDFFGERSIAGQPLRVSTATAMESSSLMQIQKEELLRVVHDEHEFSDRFVAHMLRRNVRIEEDWWTVVPARPFRWK